MKKCGLKCVNLLTWETVISRTPGLPEAISEVNAGPTSSGLVTLIPSAPIVRLISAKLGFARFVPT